MLRPWPAHDGLLVRIRLVGGAIPAARLAALVGVAEEYGDGAVHLTGRANLQVRGIAGTDALPPEVLEALQGTGLVPSLTHDLVRNVMVSPQSGLAGGRADLRPTAARLDALLLGDERLASLPGRFLFVLDDGRGDLVGRACDLGAVAIDEATVQLRVGDDFAEAVPVEAAPAALLDLAHVFLDARGGGLDAAWHVHELAGSLVSTVAPDPRVPVPVEPLRYGAVPGGTHVAVEGGVLRRTDLARLAADHLVVTPWHGVLVPEGQS